MLGAGVGPVNLFVVVALPPGERKSPAFKAMTAPILAAERALVEAYAPRVDEAELALRVAKARAERTAKAAESTLTREAGQDATVEALDAAADVRALAVPVMPQLVADDVTPEAAATLLAEQGGRLAVLSDEGGIFATLAGRYSGAPIFVLPGFDVSIKPGARQSSSAVLPADFWPLRYWWCFVSSNSNSSNGRAT